MVIPPPELTQPHTELNSITMDGQCYFDSEIYMDQNTDINSLMNVNSTSGFLIGAYDDNCEWRIQCKKTDMWVTRGLKSSGIHATSYSVGSDITIQSTANKFSFGMKSVTCSDTSSFTLTKSCYIGNVNANGSPQSIGLNGKLYYIKFYSGSSLIADMIPVKKTDGTICLYDKVRNKYFYNKGSGTLTS